MCLDEVVPRSGFHPWEIKARRRVHLLIRCQRNLSASAAYAEIVWNYAALVAATHGKSALQSRGRIFQSLLIVDVSKMFKLALANRNNKPPIGGAAHDARVGTAGRLKSERMPRDAGRLCIRSPR